MAKKTVGQVLRDQRAKLDMTLNAAEALTQIKKMYIVALEHDDYDALPGDFYVKAYLKQYAERLDLDYDQLVTAYEKNEPIEVDETPDLSESYQFVKPSERLEADEELGDKKWRYYLPIVLLGTVAALIIISISATVVLNKPKNSGIAEHLYSVSNSSKSKAPASHPAPSTSSISSESKAPEPPKPEIAVTGNGQALAATVKNVASPVKVNLSSTAAGLAVWIGMTNSDLPGGQITLTNATPTTTTLTGNQTVLTLGKTTGLTIKIGDTPIDLSSIVAPESPATLTITIE